MSKKQKSPYKIPKKWLGAFKCGHRMGMRQYIDDELAWEMLKRWYANNEDEEAMEMLDYLTKFNNEYYRKAGLKMEDSLHKTSQEKKDCYNRGNANYRDIMSFLSKNRIKLTDDM